MAKRWLAVMTVAIALTACQRGERADVTGSYGAGVVNGDVTVTGMANTSPAGVEVSVPATGQRVTLGADGRFSFMGLPDDAQLYFRRGDGIDASLAVVGSSYMAVELNGTSAKTRIARHHGVGRSVTPVYEIEGVVQSADATQLVVFSSKHEAVTILIDPNTVFRSGDSNVTAADVTVGARVHVKTSKSAEGAYTAIVVIIQSTVVPPPPPSQQHAEVSGAVSAVTDTTLTVHGSHGDTTVQTSPTTRIRKAGATITLAGIVVGDQVEVQGTRVDATTIMATSINVSSDSEDDDGEEVQISGTVTAVASSSLTVDTATGSMTVNTDASTRIRKQGTTIALSDIQVGDTIEAEGTKVDDTTILAKTISVEESGDDGDSQGSD